MNVKVQFGRRAAAQEWQEGTQKGRDQTPDTEGKELLRGHSAVRLDSDGHTGRGLSSNRVSPKAQLRVASSKTQQQALKPPQDLSVYCMTWISGCLLRLKDVLIMHLMNELWKLCVCIE